MSGVLVKKKKILKTWLFTVKGLHFAQTWFVTWQGVGQHKLISMEIKLHIQLRLHLLPNALFWQSTAKNLCDWFEVVKLISWCSNVMWNVLQCKQSFLVKFLILLLEYCLTSRLSTFTQVMNEVRWPPLAMMIIWPYIVQPYCASLLLLALESTLCKLIIISIMYFITQWIISVCYGKLIHNVYCLKVIIQLNVNIYVIL